MPLTKAGAQSPQRENQADRIYAQIKDDLFDFRLMPGDRVSENELAQRMGVSRTPVREALQRLQRDGYMTVIFRSGWQVKPFDFRYYEELYDVRIALEQTAVRRLADGPPDSGALLELQQTWLVAGAERLANGATVSELDERFHALLVSATNNREMVRIHEDLTERLRIIRRLDFTQEDRVNATYAEHAAILKAILRGEGDQAARLLAAHITQSKLAVQQITLYKLQQARNPETS